MRVKEIFFAPHSLEKLKLRLNKILFLTGMWIAAGLFFAVNQLLSKKSSLADIFPDSGINNSVIIITIIITTTVVGLITGSFEAFISEKRYRKQHIGKLILYNTGFYLVLYFCLFIFGVFIYKEFFFTGKISAVEFGNQILNYISSPHALLSFLVFGIIVLFSLFFLHIREKFGLHIMSSFLSGKYFYPKEEKRIFMFLDIKSATTIAEKLGALKYHQFLNDFYYEITYPILCKKGEIYQYVGDEITISWSEKNGLKNSNCIECFFEIQDTIKNASQSFIEKYGIVPEFKAGVHVGNTVAGEMGIIKREVVYSGDTLNTAARIQSMCNLFGEKLLISKELYDSLSLNEKYSINEIGEQSLKGRTAKVLLYGIKKEQNVLLESVSRKSNRKKFLHLRKVII